MQISPAAALFSRPGPADWFTGNVHLDEVASPPAPARLRAARVTFAPGARTAWHTHPLGQSLHILSGICRIQVKGQPVLELAPGDTANIAPGELHWHGATPTAPMVHLAMQENDDAGVAVVWLDHVTDAEYTAHP